MGQDRSWRGSPPTAGGLRGTHDPMGWTPTLINLALAGGAFAFCSWRAGRPVERLDKVRMTPWTTLSLAAAVWAILMVVHAVNLLGVPTGRA
jgi:hypothetical protein